MYEYRIVESFLSFDTMEFHGILSIISHSEKTTSYKDGGKLNWNGKLTANPTSFPKSHWMYNCV